MAFWKTFLAAALLTLATAATSAEPVQVLIKTSLGDITVELDSEKAPKTVENFLAYVDDEFYNGTIFHRVIKDFMIQGGGFTAEMEDKDTRAPIPNEAENGLKNTRGTIAMARTTDPNSATAQFFINHADNSFLDHTDKTTRGWGYAVFGKVVDGMDVVDAIATTPTTYRDGLRDVPAKSVVIESITRVPAADENAGEKPQ